MVAAARKEEGENTDGHVQDEFRRMRNHYRVIVDGTNINSSSLLTTDYLNHFSSIMMLIEMLPMAPEDFVEEISAWQPLSYKEHFEESGFRDKELAIAAYDHAPRNIRKAFDHTVDALQSLCIHLVNGVREAMEAERIEDLTRLSGEGVPQLRELLDHAAAIVNGYAEAGSLTVEPAPLGAEDTGAAQAAVDKLFD